MTSAVTRVAGVQEQTNVWRAGILSSTESVCLLATLMKGKRNQEG